MWCTKYLSYNVVKGDDFMTNNNILLLKLIWLGYTTQHIHHLLKLNPEFLNSLILIEIDSIKIGTSYFIKVILLIDIII